MLLIALVLCSACTKPQPQGRQELKARFIQSEGLELCLFGEKQPSLRALAQRLLAEIEAAGAYSGELRILEDPGQASASRPRLCLGLASDSKLMALLEPLGVEALPRGFRWRGLEHTQAGDALLACLPDPDRDGLPLLLLMGVDADSLGRRSFSLPAPWISSLRTWQGAGPGMRAELALDGSPRETSFRDRHAARAQLDFQPHSTASPSLHAYRGTGVGLERLAAYAARFAPLKERLEERFGAGFEGSIQLFTYAHVEDMQAALGHSQLAWLDAGSLSVHALLAPGLPDDGGAALARALALGIAGQPREAWWLEALGTACAGSWWGRDALELARAMDAAGLLPNFQAAVAPDAASMHARDLLGLARAWYAHALFLDAAAGQQASLARVWAEGLGAAGRQFAPLGPNPSRTLQIPSWPVSRRAALVSRAWRGAALYGSPQPEGASVMAARAAEVALEEAKQAGANALSITLSVAPDVAGAWLSAGGNARPWSSSSDVELASLLAAIKSKGMGSMLVLRPLLGVGQAPIDLGLLNQKEGRDRFLRRMQSFALHYGLLGEIMGLDMLCLGSALDQGASTVIQEVDQKKPVMLARKKQLLAGWIELIERTRLVFGGALTYGTQMGSPLYQVAFWEQLDFVGMLGFGPLSKQGFDVADGVPSAAALKLELGRQLRKGLQFQAKTGHPALFIQLGFPARDGSWDAWTSARGAPSEAAQERYYQALAQGVGEFVKRGHSVNFFLWNWSVGAEPEAGAVGSFSIRERLSPDLLRTLFHSK